MKGFKYPENMAIREISNSVIRLGREKVEVTMTGKKSAPELGTQRYKMTGQQLAFDCKATS